MDIHGNWNSQTTYSVTLPLISKYFLHNIFYDYIRRNDYMKKAKYLLCVSLVLLLLVAHGQILPILQVK